MALTEEEKKELVQNVVNQIKTESQSVDELETVDTLEGVVSLPAMRGEKVVGAPLKLLSKPAEEAAAVARSSAAVADASAKKADVAVATMSGYEDRVKLAMNGASARFDGFVESVIIEYISVMSIDGVYYDIKNKRFCAKKDGHYYNNWGIGDNTNAASMYLDDSRKNPRKDKIYVCGTNLYVWSDEEGNLVVYGATAQDGVQGTSKNYVYSSPSDETRTVLSGKLWIYQHGDYNQFLRFKHWGAANDTAETDYSQVQLPNAWTGGTGLLRYDIYRRLDEFKLREQNSTATEVKIVTPIFTTGGTRELSISQATTAKAGVMTAADKTKLDGLSDISVEGARAAKDLYAAVGNTKLFGPKNIFNTNNSTLTGAVDKAVYDGSTLTQYTKGSPFDVFCSKGIKSDIHSEKYMIWFGLRKSATNIERYSCQQVIGQTEEEFYKYETIVAFRLNNGKVYTPHKGSSGLDIGTSTNYIVSRECVIPSYSDLHDAATSEKDGLMSAADKAQLDVIAASMDSFGNSITEQAKRIYDLEQCKPLATKSRNGFMSSEDKTQLQGTFADFNARRQANDVEGYVGRSNVISVPGTVENTQIAADFYRNAEERDYTPGDSFDVYVSAGYDKNNPNKQCVWFGSHIEPTLYVRYRLDYWLHGTADTLVGKYLCDTSDKYYEVREGAVGEYISEALDDTPCIMTIADKRLLNKIKQKLGL
nr:MAG TPA: hypothetical protein [Caudoviricetes sp.]DAR25408.1 MAG TPA: hypothetical protein [Bacteriophage sp.]